MQLVSYCDREFCVPFYMVSKCRSRKLLESVDSLTFLWPSSLESSRAYDGWRVFESWKIQDNVCLFRENLHDSQHLASLGHACWFGHRHGNRFMISARHSRTTRLIRNKPVTSAATQMRPVCCINLFEMERAHFRTKVMLKHSTCNWKTPPLLWHFIA